MNHQNFVGTIGKPITGRLRRGDWYERRSAGMAFLLQMLWDVLRGRSAREHGPVSRRRWPSGVWLQLRPPARCARSPEYSGAMAFLLPVLWDVLCRRAGAAGRVSSHP